MLLNTERKKLVIDEIKSFNNKISSKNRKVKYEKMLRSPLSFFRGTNHLFWRDLYSHERLWLFANKHTNTWIQGDLHVCNIGIFNNSIEQIVFDFNDFDESFFADFQFDIWRMAVSIVLVAREVLDLNRDDQIEIIEDFSERYLKKAASFYGNNEDLSLYFTKENTKHKLEDRLKDTEDDEGVKEMLDSWTTIKNGKRIFEDDEIAQLPDQKKNQVAKALNEYGNTLSAKLKYDNIYFKILDIAERLYAGTGSLGIPRYYVLIDGASTVDDETCRILDVKFQSKPTAYDFLNNKDKKLFNKRFPSQAKRVVDANKALILLYDYHLGYLNLPEGEFSVRQRSPYKADFGYENIDDKDQLEEQVEQWAEVIATTHARAADTFFKKELANIYDNKLKEFTDNVVEIAVEYADIVINDFEIFSHWQKK